MIVHVQVFVEVEPKIFHHLEGINNTCSNINLNSSVSLLRNTITSVLSSFNSSLLAAIHFQMSSTQFLITAFDAIKSFPVTNTFSCVSSAYIWNSRPCLLMMSESGTVYRMNNVGLRSAPWQGHQISAWRALQIEPFIFTCIWSDR